MAASTSPSASISPSPSAAFEPTINEVTAIQQVDNIIITKVADVELIIVD